MAPEIDVPGPPPSFDPSTTAQLPPPARRLLGRVLPPGTPLHDRITVDMLGEIRLGRWLPFHARQVLRAGSGFRWEPVVGRVPLRVVGADVLDGDRAEVAFRLLGVVPVARESGPDTVRSARGRLAAETVAWVPQALTPQLGARWRPIDDTSAAVAPAGVDGIEVVVSVDGDGRLTALTLDRWGSPGDGPPGSHPFGGHIDEEGVTAAGVRIAGAGTVGWWWGTPRWDEGEFFRFRVVGARYG